MHTKNILQAGNTSNATKALIMLHGRGGSAQDILSLADLLQVEDFLLLAPQATNSTWYPHSFMAEIDSNQPYLDSALALVGDTVQEALAKGIQEEHIYFLGFSQGACLTLEYVTRHAKRYGGAIAFTGGLIGDQIYQNNYSGNFYDTPVFIGSSDPDFHVPVSRVHESTQILESMGAQVTEKIYPGMPHTIVQDEIDQANLVLGGG
ncbi:phospholipase [Sphingobacterium sp. DK4209]|uniref:Phospholipase n=1 Tax=Sphingobacterium zhuxiongii TaxID=2662364 RepID=A0A5Q0QFN0_9SPHI|nr:MULTISPECIES: dienelactone hydrolase family protein [unclassified Sphingobacterium]MVZ66954.1 phospholipase [Sphingobacterium sp. DK4209]QGA26628.1 phospholipase [Sphingobacterium sp. dk4302]